MILFKEFILEENTLEELSEEELDQLADSLSWEDIEDLYSPDEFVMEEEIVEKAFAKFATVIPETGIVNNYSSATQKIN